MADKTPTWIENTSLAVRNASLFLQYRDYKDREFSIELQYEQPIITSLAAFPMGSVHQLINYLAISQSLRFFDYDYYDEIIAYYELDDMEMKFFERLLVLGMAEFRYVNHLGIHTHTSVRGTHTLPRTDSAKEAPKLQGAVVCNGGGKDGVVASEAIHAAGQDLTWFTLNKEGIRGKVIEVSGFQDQLTTSRIITESSATKPLKGHKPLNATLGFLATLAALIKARKYAVAGNEYSANKSNLTVDDLGINHQYTKSYAFELDLAQLIDRLDLGVQYFSVLRTLYELQILQIFKDFPKYHHHFISCNKGVRKGFWCLKCDKCAFLVLALTAIDPEIVEKVWGDRYVIASVPLRPFLVGLISTDGPRPFDCVGTLEECQLALGLIARNDSLWEALPADLRSVLQVYIPSTMNELEKQIMGPYRREEHIPEDLRENIFTFFDKHLGT